MKILSFDIFLYKKRVLNITPKTPLSSKEHFPDHQRHFDFLIFVFAYTKHNQIPQYHHLKILHFEDYPYYKYKHMPDLSLDHLDLELSLIHI